MLVLSRKPGESIQIGENVTVKVVQRKGNRVRLAIDAPGDLEILRGELVERRQQWESCRSDAASVSLELVSA